MNTNFSVYTHQCLHIRSITTFNACNYFNQIFNDAQTTLPTTTTNCTKMVANYKQPITSPEYHLSNSCKQLRATELQRLHHGLVLYNYRTCGRLASHQYNWHKFLKIMCIISHRCCKYQGETVLGDYSSAWNCSASLYQDTRKFLYKYMIFFPYQI